MLFKEEQYFKHSKIGKIALAFVGVIFSIILIGLMVSKPESNKKLILAIAVCFASAIPFVLIFLLVKLKVRIDDRDIRYKYAPFVINEKTIKWTEVAEFRVREYSPLKEFGGWGYRRNIFTKKTCLNISGKIGLELKLKNGRTLMIGTQKRSELESFISKLKVNG